MSTPQCVNPSNLILISSFNIGRNFDKIIICFSVIHTETERGIRNNYRLCKCKIFSYHLTVNLWGLIFHFFHLMVLRFCNDFVASSNDRNPNLFNTFIQLFARTTRSLLQQSSPSKQSCELPQLLK